MQAAVAVAATPRYYFHSLNFCEVSMRLFYTDHFELPLPDEHKFPMAKYRRLRERIASEDWADDAKLSVPHAATDEELKLVHTAKYLADVVNGTLSAKEVRRIGFPWSTELVERSRRSTGATIEAALAAKHSGWISANLAGGTHHAFSDRGEGYCVFNDVAVAARVLQQQADGPEKILVVDCDVHQGNGTAEIFQQDDSVVTFSIHGKRNYPLKKVASDLDVALDNGTQDAEYLAALEDALAQLFLNDFGFVFYVAGADPFEGDRLGRLALSKRGLRERDELVLGACREKKLPCAITMAGGYAAEIDDIVDIHANTIQCALAFT